MSDFAYALIVLTHGDGETLEDCLNSFAERVTPMPERLVILRDGNAGYSYVPNWGIPFFVGAIEAEQIGFCRATAAAWRVAAAATQDWIFHLEHDFVFRRDVDLRDLAAVLDSDPRLAQVALCRDAANESEREAGGLVESRPGAFEPMLAKSARPRHVYDAVPWLRHSLWFSTNPSLMRRDFMQANPFSEAESECEGKFGIELRERGYRFGLFGDGKVYVDHVGVRTGKGY